MVICQGPIYPLSGPGIMLNVGSGWVRRTQESMSQELLSILRCDRNCWTDTPASSPSEGQSLGVLSVASHEVPIRTALQCPRQGSANHCANVWPSLHMPVSLPHPTIVIPEFTAQINCLPKPPFQAVLVQNYKSFLILMPPNQVSST